MPVPPDNTARIDFRFSMGSEPAMVVMHAICDTPPVTQLKTDLLASELTVWATAELMPLFSSDLLLDDIIVSSYLGGGLAFQSVSAIGATGGDVTESIEPNQVAAVVTWRTILPDKSGRGRSFFPGLSSNKVSLGSAIDSVWLGDIQDAADDLLLAGTLTDFSLGVWSRVDGVVRPVVSAQARSIVRTQKRRLPRN